MGGQNSSFSPLIPYPYPNQTLLYFSHPILQFPNFFFPSPFYSLPLRNGRPLNSTGESGERVISPYSGVRGGSRPQTHFGEFSGWKMPLMTGDSQQGRRFQSRLGKKRSMLNNAVSQDLYERLNFELCIWRACMCGMMTMPDSVCARA